VARGGGPDRRAAALRAVVAALGLAAAALVASCAPFLSSYDLAPNGLARDEDAIRRTLAFEAPKVYGSLISGNGAAPEDPLLRLMYAGIAGRYAGERDASSRLLDVASYLAEDRVTISLSREALSLMTSDRSLAYVPGSTERLMIPYPSALNYLETGDLQGAAVEARRIEALLDQYLDGVAPDERPRDAGFLHHFAGAVFEAAGEWDAAEVAYRRAGRIAESLGAPPRGSGGADGGEIVVLIERGFVPHRVEQSVVMVIPSAKLDRLTEGSMAERALAATAAATYLLVAASARYGDRSGLYHDHGFRTAVHLAPWEDDRCVDGRWSRSGAKCADDEEPGAPYLLRIAWPVLFQEPGPSGTVRVRAGELGADPIAWLDVADGIRRDFDAERSAMVARAIARAAAKLAVTTAVEKTVARRDETAGQLAGILTNMGTALAERADTRGWHLLPGEIGMVRLRLPAGTHELSFDAGRPEGSARTVPFAVVTVRAGETRFVSTRLWR
jgi:uncharacterized protein